MRCNPSSDLALLGHPSSARSASFLHPQGEKEPASHLAFRDPSSRTQL